MINWIGVIQDTLMITSFVIIMMLLIEFINAATSGGLIKLLNKNSYIQIIAGTILGIIPGCVGTFAVVSLYSQRLLSFGALVATMIATSGDEAYFMLAVMPKEALILFVILAVLAILAGVLTDNIFKNKDFIGNNTAIVVHHHDHDCDTDNHRILSFKNISFDRYRIYMVSIIFVIILLTFTGWIGHSHSDSLIFNISSTESSETHDHHEDCEHTHLHHEGECSHEHNSFENIHDHENGAHSHHGEGDIIKIIIISCSVVLLFIILFSDEHFVKEHLWEHIIKKHLPKIFLWIIVTLIVIGFILNITDLESWISKNFYIALLIAVLIGFIPQSGPHLIFVVLFVQGTIPFSILLANSIVQDGHGALPLLAESRKSFFVMKGISAVLGLIVGLIGLLIGF
ncbi:MAG: arsenic efflux protein [Bacteroidales bacterium]|jgi:hypothetical protein|nr:arsenic efflux protein [Bacteroidales bacterium]